MNEYKKCLLDILLWFHNFCEEHQLRYYLVEGTMLGAARHEGFIPWDDDIDVGMPRSDYDKLKELMGESVHDGKYMLETEDSQRKEYLIPFAKVYDVTTSLVEQRRLPVTMGVYIDVFPLDGIGATDEEAKRNFKKIGFLHNILASRTVKVREGRKWYKNLAVRIFQALPEFVINEKQLLKRITGLCKERAFDNSKYVGNLVSTYRAKEIMPRELYGEPKLYLFEGNQVFGVEDYDGYLSHLYGDWRTLPPVEKRKSAHTMEQIDLHTSFLKQMNESK